MMLNLLIHGLFILTFTLQQNGGCSVMLQMSFASQLYGRCYVLPEQLSKDQSSISNKSKCTVLSYISQAAPFTIYPWVLYYDGRSSITEYNIQSEICCQSKWIKRDVTEYTLPGVEMELSVNIYKILLVC